MSPQTPIHTSKNLKNKLNHVVYILTNSKLKELIP